MVRGPAPGLVREEATTMGVLVSYFKDPEWFLEEGLNAALEFWAAGAATPRIPVPSPAPRSGLGTF